MELGAMNIRDATREDADVLVEMGRAFFEEAGMPERFRALGAPDLAFCPDSFVLSCQMLAEKGILLVAEAGGEVVGMLGAALAPVPWNFRVGMAQECWLYVRPDKRKGGSVALLRAYETKAQERGIVICGMVAETGQRGDALGRLYKAKDYVPAATVWWRSIPSNASEQQEAA